MKIKWKNIFGLVLLIIIVIALFKLPVMLDNISWRIQLPYYFNDPALGLMFLGLICVTIVAVAKIITNR